MMHTVEPAGDGLVLFIIVIVLLVLSWATVVARVVVRRKLIRQFGGDDWLMVVGLILFSVTSGLLISFIYFGGGYHSDQLTPETISLGTKYYFVAQIFYCASTVPIKCSICVALIRIAGTRLVYRYILFGIFGLTVVSALATAIGILNVCHPISTLWGESDGTCDPSINSKVGYFFSAVCIITDWSLAILPVWILWNIQLKQRIRVIVAMLLALGAFASCATIIRLRFLILYDNPDEFLFGSARIAIWSTLELGTGIFAGSMAHLRPLMRYLPCFSQSSYPGESYDPNNTRSGMRMETLGGRTVVEGGGGRKSSGKRDVDLIYKDLKVGDDGDSQEHILEAGGGRREEDSDERGIRRVTEVTVTGGERNSDEGGGYEQQPPLPLSEPALGRSAWREE